MREKDQDPIFETQQYKMPKYGTDINSPVNSKAKSPSKILGNYHMAIVNRAFADFW